jgi:fluoride ion exporter CrcB/FEX
MGVLSPAEDGHPLPWFRVDHHLQRHTALHVGFKLGFCGCLTSCTLIIIGVRWCWVCHLLLLKVTFHVFEYIYIYIHHAVSSWNTQMVVMMDGTNTDFGPQVATALFGYLIGGTTAVSSFIFGRHVFEWLRSQHTPSEAPSVENGNTAESEIQSLQADCSADGQRYRCGMNLVWTKYSLIVAVAGLFGAFAFGDAVEGILFYRQMWMAMVLSPFGAILRWRLSELNTRELRWTGVEWFLWGTFLANIVAVVISILTEALVSQVDADDESFDWVKPAMGAVAVGFAGSLSTVSTMVAEMFFRDTPGQAHIYWLSTILCSMLISLAIYCPIVRAS